MVSIILGCRLKHEGLEPCCFLCHDFVLLWGSRGGTVV